MKIQVLMKTPDALQMGLERHFATPEEDSDPEATKYLIEHLYDKIEKKWMEYGEYLTVEFDMDTMVATVLGKGK